MTNDPHRMAAKQCFSPSLISKDLRLRIEEDGFLTLQDALTREQIDQCLDEIRGIQSQDDHSHSQRNIMHLSTKSPVFAKVWCNPLLLAAVEATIQDDFVFARDEYRGPTPGGGWQAMHVDWAETVQGPPYPMAVVIVALSDFTEKTGATRVVPGSHHLEKPPSNQKKTDSFQGETLLIGNAGTAFVLNGSLWHSGTLNVSESTRHSILLTFWQRRLPNGRLMVDQSPERPHWVDPKFAWLFKSH